VVVDSVTGKVHRHATRVGRGFSDESAAFAVVLPLILAELERNAADGVTDTHRLAQSVRRVVGRWVSDTYRRAP